MPWYIHSIRGLYRPGCQAGLPDGRWVYAVPEPYTAGRLMAAWWVLTGRAFAFAWPKPGDLEDALGADWLAQAERSARAKLKPQSTWPQHQHQEPTKTQGGA